MPAWRNVSFVPAARPLCSTGAEPSATRGQRRVEQAGADAGDEHAGQRSRSTTSPRRRASSAPCRRPRGRGRRRSSRAGAIFSPSGARRAGDEEDHDRAGQVGEAGLDRRQPEHLLQVQRRVEEDREERAPRSRTPAICAPVNDGMRNRPSGSIGSLTRRSIATKATSSAAGAGERGDDRRAAPADLVAAQQREHEQEQAGRSSVAWPGQSTRGARGSRDSAHVARG